MSETAPRPWWIPHFLGRVPQGVGPRELSLLGSIALALLIEEYDLAMLTAALHRIAASLGVAETDLPFYLAWIRLGALPAFAVIPLADRLGRRRIFLASLLCTGLLTFATAFSPNIACFVALQMATRTFFIAGSAVAFVMVAEEFPAEHRGWGIGMLGALGATGHAVAMILYAQVDRLPYGWRALYLVGVVPVLLFPWFRRRIVETTRYRDHAAQRTASEMGLRAVLAPLTGLARHHPARALGIAVAGFLPAIGLISAFQFTGYYTQDVLGWSPGQYSLMVVVGGAIGIIGNVAAGRLGDRLGRRWVGLVLLGSFPIWVGLFYNRSGWIVSAAWIGIVFVASGGRAILRALATELFPTAQRASASGLFAILDAVGAATGLFLLWGAIEGEGQFAYYTSLLALATAAGGLVLLLFPETKQRELEAISTDAVEPRAATGEAGAAALGRPADETS